MEPKQQLADLMDAFAAAKASGNETLQRLVLGQINQFFQTHVITPIQQQEQPPQPKPQSPIQHQQEPLTSDWN